MKIILPAVLAVLSIMFFSILLWQNLSTEGVGDATAQTISTSTIQSENKKQCFREGEQEIGKDTLKITCCSGLKEVESVGDFDENCHQIRDALYNLYVCTKCGDKICGLGENNCNCSYDCAKDGLIGWQAYKNEQYGFELKLPSYFSQPHISTSTERSTHKVSYTNKHYSYTTTTPFVTMRADDTRERSGVAIEINIFPADSYSYAYGPSLYDSAGETWYYEDWDEAKNKPTRRDVPSRDQIIFAVNGWKGYRFGWFDMGGVEEAIAIPYGERMFEISLSYACLMEDCLNPPSCTEKISEWLGCTENNNYKFQEILNSIKFTDNF